MKYLVLCSALLLSISLAAQQATGNSPASADKPIVVIPNGKLPMFSGSGSNSTVFVPGVNAYENQPGEFRWARPWKGRVAAGTRVWLADNFQSMCATMRTYRVKREDRDSDVTREAGYSECISISKFRIENAAPELKSGDTITPSE